MMIQGCLKDGSVGAIALIDFKKGVIAPINFKKGVIAPINFDNLLSGPCQDFRTVGADFRKCSKKLTKEFIKEST